MYSLAERIGISTTKVPAYQIMISSFSCFVEKKQRESQRQSNVGELAFIDHVSHMDIMERRHNDIAIYDLSLCFLAHFEKL